MALPASGPATIVITWWAGTRSRDDRQPALAAKRPATLASGSAGRFAYADPPYPGKAGYYVERQEVDHAFLVDRLVTDFPDGWALSTSAAALRDVLPMCPVGIRVAVWRRQHRPTKSRRPLSAWEPLIVCGGRYLPTDRPQEVIDHLDYRGRYDSFPGALVGMKPPEFAVWMFAQLGAGPGDVLVDLFPGSGAIGRAWTLYTSLGPNVDERDASLPAAWDASQLQAPAPRDTSRGDVDAGRLGGGAIER